MRSIPYRSILGAPRTHSGRSVFLVRSHGWSWSFAGQYHRIGSVVVCFAAITLVAVACDRQDDRDHDGRPTTDQSALKQILAQYSDIGLPAAEPQDATATVCGSAKCAAAMSTSQITVMLFATAGQAQLYDAARPDLFQVQNIVVKFGPNLSPQQRASYQQATVRAIE